MNTASDDDCVSDRDVDDDVDDGDASRQALLVDGEEIDLHEDERLPHTMIMPPDDDDDDIAAPLEIVVLDDDDSNHNHNEPRTPITHDQAIINFSGS